MEIFLGPVIDSDGNKGGDGGGGHPVDPQTLGYPFAEIDRDFVRDGIMTDCQALAAFASTMATIFSSNDSFVQAFGVLTSDAGKGLVAYNSEPVQLGGDSHASGFATQFQDGYGSDQGPNSSDQAHHFAGFFQLGYQAPALTTIAPTIWEALGGTLSNQGDINLGQAAAYLGARAEVRSNTHIRYC